MAGWKARVFWGVVLVGCLTVLIMARLLQPDPRGYGTHSQITGVPCLFKTITDLPCPVCGMTTSFAYGARLQMPAAVRTQPFGALLFVLVVAAVPLAIKGLVAGRLQMKSPPAWAVAGFAACLILAWIYKILVYRGIL